MMKVVANWLLECFTKMEPSQSTSTVVSDTLDSEPVDILAAPLSDAGAVNPALFFLLKLLVHCLGFEGM